MFAYKECPFCGGLDLIARAAEDMDGSLLHAIWCEDCDAAGPLVAGNEHRAWEAWARRTDAERSWLNAELRGTSHTVPEDLSLRGTAKPCPFCGHSELTCDDTEGGPSSIACLTCEASAVANEGGRLDSIGAWNGRSR